MVETYQSISILLDTKEPALLGPDRRAGTATLDRLESLLADALTAGNLSGEAASLVRALVLLWHDHLEASHTISQDLHGPDGSFVHGLMHRREPDFGNAAYWFRRVGDHPAYPAIAEDVGRITTDSTFKESLLRGGRWNPLAMIDACEAAAVEAADAPDIAFLREVQGIEFHRLLVFFCRRPGHV